KMDDAAAFQKLIQMFPVPLDGQPFRKKELLRVTGLHKHRCYNRWRAEQRKRRQQNIFDQYNRRLPTEGQVTHYIEKMGWSTNTPAVSEVLQNWKPHAEVQPNGKDIENLVKLQTWRGLHIVDDPVKGKKVITSRCFQKGEVVCDYHGNVITETTGEALMAQMAEGEMGYLFFFDGPKQKMCFDSHEEHCTCHPYGHKHSNKKANLRPIKESFVIDEKTVITILFLAKREIAVGEELLHDYGVSRKSFHGEGQALGWL
uniref:SET domain-containing protein n=1 Tax=Lepisosteus oculatus TaxID=7918 RepID=W5LVB1_LEPOC